ncbi:MAG: hypothetical protein LKM37_00540 [Bacteroidales bacterium]|jgi:hypothetical protein|nr:hypothetical protein [Bacteroidales bacterium]MCI1733285.1 hypothetical protein [Bacteroidales bacterium]
MRGFKHILLIVGCVAALAACGHANKSEKKDVKNPTLSRDSILIGDQVVMSADFSVPDKAPIQVIPYAQTLAAVSAGAQGGEEMPQDSAAATQIAQPQQVAMPAQAAQMPQSTGLPDSTSASMVAQPGPSQMVQPAQAGTVEVVQDFVIDTLSFKDGVRKLRAKAIITSFDSGYYKLPAPVILMGNKKGQIDTVKLSENELAVSTIPVDTASFKPYQLGVKDSQMKYPITFRDFIPWILLLLLLAAIAYCITRYFKLKAQNKDFFGRSKIKIPPHVIALKKLEKLRDEKLWQSGKEKQYFTGITDTLREYIQKRYGFGAMEKTSTEIMESLQDKKIEEKTYNNLGEMFKVADLVKFAKYSPLPDENENAIPAAENFVNFAYMQELKEQEERAEAAAKKQADKAARTAADQAAKSADNKQNTKKTDGPVGNKKEEEK